MVSNTYNNKKFTSLLQKKKRRKYKQISEARKQHISQIEGSQAD